MKKISFLLLISLTLTTAQSFFNSNGLGEIMQPVDARGNAVGNPNALSIAYPGNYLELNQTMLRISLFGTALLARQNDMQRAIGNVRPGAFYGAIPLPTGTRILLNADSRFNQDFDIWSDSATTTPCRYHITSRGGIYALNFGIAQSLLNRFCLGMQFQQLIGGSRENWHYSTSEGMITTDTIEINYTGRNLRFGITAQISFFNLAGGCDLPTTLTTRRYKHLHGITADTFTSYQITLPGTFAFALSIVPFQHTHLGTGIELHPWSKSTLSTPDTTLLARYRDGWRWSIGLEYDPFARFPIRAGYSRTDWYYSNTKTGSPIKESGIHLGTTLPLPQFGALEIAGEILFRTGTTPTGVLSETAGRIILSLVYEERWGKRTRRWGY